MAEAWQTLEEAALTLGISSRTLHRRLARGEFDTRMENGRREVLVVIEEPDPSLARLAAAGRFGKSERVSDASATSATAADTDATSVSVDYGTTIDTAADEVQQTMLALHEDRLRRTDLAIMAYQQSVTVAAAEARRAITRSRVAWGVAGVAIVMLFLGATWGTHRVTQATAEVSHLTANVRQLTDSVDVKLRETEELRQDSQAAKVSAARAEGELVAAKRQVEQLIQDREAGRARLSAHVVAADMSAGGAATQPAAVVSAPAQPAASVIAATQPVPATQASATTKPAKS